MNKVDYKTLFEVQETAKVYGFYYKQSSIGNQTFYQLFEVGSDYAVFCNNSEAYCIEWCNWFFNRLEQEYHLGINDSLIGNQRS